MTFKPHITDDGHIPPWEQLPCGAITPKVGLALYMSGGKLLSASGANIPTHICMEEHSQALTAGSLIYVVKINPQQVWESRKADSTAMTLGTAYDVSSGGLTVSGSTTNGCFLVDYVEGSAAGSVVRGRFIK